jgi:hypothetical protein
MRIKRNINETKNIKIYNMYTLDKVIKTFKKIISNSDNELLISYYEKIVEFMLLEHKHKDIVKKSNKPIYHYFQHALPHDTNDYFMFLYHTYNPVRFAIETFDSIEEIRLELKR